MSYLAAKLVTAVVKWDNRFQGKFCHGHVVKLYADGVVFECMAYQDRDGKIAYSDGKKRMTLVGLKADFKRDLDGMGKHFRAMYRNKDYEICSPLMMEAMK